MAPGEITMDDDGKNGENDDGHFVDGHYCDVDGDSDGDGDVDGDGNDTYFHIQMIEGEKIKTVWCMMSTYLGTGLRSAVDQFLQVSGQL